MNRFCISYIVSTTIIYPQARRLIRIPDLRVIIPIIIIIIYYDYDRSYRVICRLQRNPRDKSEKIMYDSVTRNTAVAVNFTDYSTASTRHRPLRIKSNTYVLLYCTVYALPVPCIVCTGCLPEPVTRVYAISIQRLMCNR